MPALHLPRTAWPIMLSLGACSEPGMVEAASEVAVTELGQKLSGYETRSAIRVVTVDADEADAALGDLGVDPGAHRDVRAFCAEHPQGRLVIAYADYQPRRHGFTILGG